jgi:hypothetical protein
MSRRRCISGTFRPRACQFGYLLSSRLDIGRVGIGHRLHDDRVTTANADFSYLNGRRRSAERSLGIHWHVSLR